MVTTNMCEKRQHQDTFLFYVENVSADDLCIAIECMFTWYWVADFCEDKNITFPLGLPLLWSAKMPSAGPCLKKQLKKH